MKYCVIVFSLFKKLANISSITLSQWNYLEFIDSNINLVFNSLVFIFLYVIFWHFAWVYYVIYYINSKVEKTMIIFCSFLFTCVKTLGTIKFSLSNVLATIQRFWWLLFQDYYNLDYLKFQIAFYLTKSCKGMFSFY